MGRPSLATVDDLEALIGSVADPLRAQVLLDRASAIARAYAGATWLNDAETELAGVPADVPGVVVGMVDRATSNPDGVTQEATGPFSRSFGSDAAARLYLTAGDKLVLRAAVGNSGIGTISTTRGPLETSCAADDLWPDEITVAWP